MNKRKITALLLSLSLLGLTACAGQQEPINAQSNDAETAQNETADGEAAQSEAETAQDETMQGGLATQEEAEEGETVHDELPQDETTHDEPVTGGWSVNSGDLSLDANPDVKAAFEKATEGLTGYAYEPIAYLGLQVVAGNNYRILCRAVAVVPESAPAYEIVTVYEDLEGAAAITDTVALPGVPEESADVTGGWTVNAADVAPDANPDAKDALAKATGDLLGVGYEPVAYLASQVVSGMNYKMFCRTTPIIPDAEPFFTVVTLYADLEGNVEVTDVTNVDLAEL